jgi:hypothetical protein
MYYLAASVGTADLNLFCTKYAQWRRTRPEPKRGEDIKHLLDAGRFRDGEKLGTVSR